MTASKHKHIWDFVKKWYPDYEHSVDIHRAQELHDRIMDKDEDKDLTVEELQEQTLEYYSLCTRIYEESILAHHEHIAEEAKRAEEVPWY